jgi:hypothetical protein
MSQSIDMSCPRCGNDVITVEFNYLAGYRETRDDPGEAARAEIINVSDCKAEECDFIGSDPTMTEIDLIEAFCLEYSDNKIAEDRMERRLDSDWNDDLYWED